MRWTLRNVITIENVINNIQENFNNKTIQYF